MNKKMKSPILWLMLFCLLFAPVDLVMASEYHGHRRKDMIRRNDIERSKRIQKEVRHEPVVPKVIPKPKGPKN